MYGIYAHIGAIIGGILMVNVTIYSIHGSYGSCSLLNVQRVCNGISVCSVNLQHFRTDFRAIGPSHQTMSELRILLLDGLRGCFANNLHNTRLGRLANWLNMVRVTDDPIQLTFS